MFGKVMRWMNKKGKTRIIGIVEKDQDYKTAGQPRSVRDPNWKPPAKSEVRHYESSADRLRENEIRMRRDQRDRDQRPRATPAPKRQTEAERIADKMAKASRAAAEGKDNDR